MSDEDAFYEYVASSPSDGNRRMELADFLEERAGTEACPDCEAKGKYRSWGGIPCRTCSGTGRVPDRTARLAAGYRAMGELGRRAFGGERYFTWFYLSEIGGRYGLENPASLPKAWMTAGAEEPMAFDTRRAAEDAAAEAWCAMTEAERAEILAKRVPA